MPLMANMTSSLERLPLDVRDRLLMSLPNFATLRVAVLSCKALHEVYAMRKHSIFCTVVENEVGPALAEALVASRLTRDLTEYHDGGEFKDKVADEEGWYWESEISVKDAYALEGVARVAAGLEFEYSLRYKDRGKQTSALTYTESLAFRRALYRNWILSLLCRSVYDGEEDVDDMDDAEIDPATSESFVRILSNLDDKSLCAVYQVYGFLDELYGHTEPHQRYDRLTGEARVGSLRLMHFIPPKIFDSFKMQEFGADDYDYDAPALNVVNTGLNNLLRKRDVVQVFEKKFKGQALLDHTSEGYVGECHKCRKATGWLYNDSCWPRLSEHLPEHLLMDCLPGRLPSNQHARAILHQYVTARDFYQHFMEDIIASQNDPAASWPKGEWVCGDCVVRFITQEVLGWLLRRLGQDNYSFKTNCWYGYKCRTQTHNQEHAGKLNHFCEPDPSKEDGH